MAEYIPSFDVGKVVRVIDGDTLQIEDGRTIRLQGINTPEKNQLGYEEVFENGEHTLYTLEDYEINEKLTRTKVVRKGRRVIKWKIDKPGFKVVMVNGRPKEVRIKSKERITRKKAAKKAARKAKSKKGTAAQKRKRSIKLRQK